MGLLLQQIFSRETRYVSNLDRVGRPVGSGSQNTSDSDEYDVIIVGGGTAGCVLASRLSEDPSVRVLVLESGGSGRSLLLTRIPVGFSLLFHTKHVYELHTEPPSSALGKKKYWPRGKMLGGCSSINAQMAQYGAPGDFDEWAKINGDDGWSWKNFGRYFTKFERYHQDPNYPKVDTSAKGSQGPMRVGYFAAFSQGSGEFVKSCTKIGIPFSPDFNLPTGTRGVNRVLTYVDENRERVSAETAYLTTNVLSRKNLTVAVHAMVTRVLFEKGDDGLKAIGVEFTREKDGVRYQARARKEVILSAGAVHSPQLLLLSGVGPTEELKKHRIEVLHDLPGVGSNLIDHPVVDVYFRNKFNNSPKHVKPHSAWEAVKVIGSTIEYLFAKRGALATNFGESAAFIRSDDPALFPPEDYPAQLRDSTSALESPDLELFTTPFAYKDHGRYMFPVHTFSIHATLLRPLSTGSLRLKSSSPWDNPSMDPKYLDAPEDVEKLVRGVRLILKIARQEPLASRLDQNDKNPLLDHQLHTKTDDELKEIVRERVETLYHPTSTCRMAPLDQNGVVDSRLKVYGMEGLRVCDASIFTTIVSGHTAGATIATAEKLADLLKEEWQSKA